MFRTISLAMLLCVPCCSINAQIKLSESKLQTWAGFENAQIVNGKVVSGPSSKPKLESVETTIAVETAVRYKFAQVKALRLPTLDKINLEPTADGAGFRFRPGTPDGTYRVEYLAFDPDKGIASEEITIVLSSVSPSPVVPDPITPDMPSLSKESRKAMIEFVQGMASDMDAVAKEIGDGKLKTVLDVSGYNVKRDIDTRNTFKKSMATILAQRLGNADLPPDGSKIFAEVANGFRSVK